MNVIICDKFYPSSLSTVILNALNFAASLYLRMRGRHAEGNVHSSPFGS